MRDILATSPTSRDLTDQALLVTYLSAATFVIGIFVPLVRLEPHLGDSILEQTIQFLSGASFAPQSHSLVGSLRSLFQHGDVCLGAILLVFSVLFPAVKLALLLGLCLGWFPWRTQAMHGLAVIGKWSLLDVLVVAVLVVSFKSFPGGTRVTPLWGVYVFAVSIFLSVTATWLLLLSANSSPGLRSRDATFPGKNLLAGISPVP